MESAALFCIRTANIDKLSRDRFSYLKIFKRRQGALRDNVSPTVEERDAVLEKNGRGECLAVFLADRDMLNRFLIESLGGPDIF
jgi:hypothetical protein